MPLAAEIAAVLPPLESVAARLDILLHVGGALAAGSAIGMERSYHGRPAGFRTHALVCVASSLLMLLTVYQLEWFPGRGEVVRIDPTRMAQGIMTGIGFLGAGVIFKEGITVRGLTTAASIWITSAIGVLMGSGLYAAGFVGTLVTLGVLSIFRVIEARIPAHRYADHRVRFERGQQMSEETLREILAHHGFQASGLACGVTDEGRYFEYRTTIRTNDARNFSRLARTLEATPTVREFRIAPAD